MTTIKPTEKFFKFNTASDKEISDFQKLIRENITSFNNLEDLSSLLDGKFSKENKFALNSSSYLNQIKIKIILDFLDVLKISKIFANGISEDFPKFNKFITNISRNFLITRENTFKDSAIFVNLIILNFPFYLSIFHKEEFLKLQKSSDKNGKIIGFNCSHILSVKNPIYRLWSKKCFYTCDCKEGKKFTVKYASIFKPDNFNNLTFNETSCKICRKPFHTDKNSEIFIEAQEIIILLPTPQNNFINNKISLWVYGDMINSIKEGEKISFLSFYCPLKTNNFHQKDFSLGSFVAININMYFEPLKLMRNIFFNFDLISVGKNSQNKTTKCLNYNNINNTNNFKEKSPTKNNPNNNIPTMNYINQHKKLLKKNKYSEDSSENLQDLQNNKISFYKNADFNSRFNQNSEINILRSIKFSKQISSAFFNFVYTMYLNNLEKSLINQIDMDINKYSYVNSNKKNFGLFDFNFFNPKTYNENLIKTFSHEKLSINPYKFNFYINLACKLSIVQREYYSKLKQYLYLHNCQQNIENFIKNNNNFISKTNINKDTDKSGNTNKTSLLNSNNNLSRSVIFKTKIFENRQKEKINEDYKKYFKFARQGLNEFNNSCDLLMKPLNLLFIFDEISTENLTEIFSYENFFNSTHNTNISYQNLIIVYPYFFPNKFQRENIINFLKSNNNKIIIIADVDMLSKYEMEILDTILGNNFNLENNFMNNNKTTEYNITFWFICSYRKICLKENKNSNNNHTNKTFQDNKFKSIELFVKNSEIILNLSNKFNSSRGVDMSIFEDFYLNKKQNENFSKEKKFKDFKSEKDFLNFSANEIIKKFKVKQMDFIDPLKNSEEKNEKINNFRICEDKILSDFDFSVLLVQKNIHLINNVKNNLCGDYHFFSGKFGNDFNNRNSDDGKQENLEDFNDSFSSLKLLEDYFLIKRNINRVDFNDIFSLLRLSSFCSMLRFSESNKIIEIPHSISNVNYLDVFLTIFLYEEFIITKYGLDTSSFGINIPRLLFKDYSVHFNDLINVSLNKVEENIKKNNFNKQNENKSIPKTRSSIRQTGITADNLIEFNINKNLNFSDNKNCMQCDKILSIPENEIMDDFLEKLTNFTYNN